MGDAYSNHKSFFLLRFAKFTKVMKKPVAVCTAGGGHILNFGGTLGVVIWQNLSAAATAANTCHLIFIVMLWERDQ